VKPAGEEPPGVLDRRANDGSPHGGADPGSGDALKRAAAERAVELIESGMRIGLGTGSTAAFAVEAVARRVRAGDLRDVVGVPTSNRTRDLARSLGLPLAELDDVGRLDLTIDGADEVDPRLDLVKGGGGALLREKIVACASRRNVIVVHAAKLVERLASTFPLPVEVVPFGWRTHLARLEGLGARAELRRTAAGVPYVTDEGHYLLDCRFDGGLDDPARIERALRARPGVVETGLFLGLADLLIVASEQGVTIHDRPEPREQGT
jgi:ribose 5-phosphate isomerase A